MDVTTRVCAGMWRLEADIGCLFSNACIIFFETISLPEVDWAGLVDKQTHLCLPSARSTGVCHWLCSLEFRGSLCCKRERLYSVIYSVATSLILAFPPPFPWPSVFRGLVKMRSLWCGVICSKSSSTEVSLSHGEVLMAWSYPCAGTAQELRNAVSKADRPQSPDT